MEFAIILIFILGYLSIALEHVININKAATALVTAVLCWTVYILTQSDKLLVHHQLQEHLGEVSGILFFLLGAMTIVELIDAHDGFQIITEKIKTKNALKLLWIISFIAFFLSAVLDNLTTTIVLVSLLRKLISDREQKLFYLGIVVIAANAGGAWSPIGDVTTTMLWIGGQINVIPIITKLFIPSLVCLIIPLLLIGRKLKGNVIPPEKTEETEFDNWMQDKPNNMSESAKRGRKLFLDPKTKCFECHFSPDFTGDDFKNVGMFDGKSMKDVGRFTITKDSADLGKFKVPTLRNVAKTPPYMHNGYFKTLKEVIDYYDDPLKLLPNAINRDTLLNAPLHLTEQEKIDLEQFLISLTDKKVYK